MPKKNSLACEHHCNFFQLNELFQKSSLIPALIWRETSVARSFGKLGLRSVLVALCILEYTVVVVRFERSPAGAKRENKFLDAQNDTKLQLYDP